MLILHPAKSQRYTHPFGRPSSPRPWLTNVQKVARGVLAEPQLHSPTHTSKNNSTTEYPEHTERRTNNKQHP